MRGRPSAAPVRPAVVRFRDGGGWGPRSQVAYVEWLCAQLRRPSHPTRTVPAVVGDLAVALQDPAVRVLYTRAGAPA